MSRMKTQRIGGVALLAAAWIASPLHAGENGSAQSTSVNPSSGVYLESTVDLNLMMQGGRLDVERRYDGAAWQFPLLDHPTQVVVVSSYYESGLEGGAVRAAIEVHADGVLHQGSGSLDACGVVTGAVLTSAGGDRLERNGAGWDWRLSDGRRALFDTAGRLLSHQDAGGSIVRFGYDAGTNHWVAVYDHWTNRVLWIDRTADGRLSRVSDAASGGRTVAYAYDGSGRLTNVTSALGGDIAYTYDAAGRLASIRTPDGRVKRLAYRDDGTLASILDAGGKGDVFEYNYDATRAEYYLSRRRADGSVHEQWMDRNFQIIRRAINGVEVEADTSGEAPVQDPPIVAFAENGLPASVQYTDGTWGRFEYGGVPSRLVREWTSAGITNAYQYDAQGRLTNSVQMVASGVTRRVALRYDSVGNLVETRMAGDASTPDSVAKASYDSRGNVTNFILNGQATGRFSYDAAGRLTAMKESSGRAWLLSYDAAGRVVGYQAPDGLLTTIAYDGNLMRITNALGDLVEVDFNALGQPEVLREDGETVALYKYDDLGHLVEHRLGTNGAVELYDYDAQDRLVSVQHELDGTVAFVYDEGQPLRREPVGVALPDYSVLGARNEEGRLAQVELMVDSQTVVMAQFEYDAQGRVSRDVNRAGLVTRYQYDGEGHLAAWSNALQGEVRQAWNVRGQLASFRDGRGREVEYLYDAAGRVTNEVERGQVVGIMVYDEGGRLLKHTTASGHATEYAYDLSGRLTQKVERAAAAISKRGFSRQSNRPGSRTTAYKLESQSLVAAENDDVLVLTATGAYNFVTSQSTVMKARGVTNTVSYSYEDRLLSTMTVNGTEVLAVERDGLGFARQLQSGPVVVYMPASNRNVRNLPQLIEVGDLRLERAYDSYGNVVSQRVVNAQGSVLRDEQAVYDVTGQNVLSLSGGTGETWQYDALGRVTSVVNEVLGTRQIELYSDGSPGDITGIELAYDLATGTLQQYGNVTYEWDSDQQMTERTDENGLREYVRGEGGLVKQVKDSEGVVLAEYQYDARNQLAEKTVQGETTLYVYNGSQLWQETSADGTARRTYLYLQDSSGTPIAFHEGGSTYTCVPDPLGRIVQVLDQDGHTVWEAEYGYHGEPLIRYAEIEFNLHQPGLMYDPQMGVYARTDGTGHYDPISGLMLAPLGRSLLIGNNPHLFGYPSGIQSVRDGETYDPNLLSELCRKAKKVPRLITAAPPVLLAGALLTGDLNALKVTPKKLPDDVCAYVYAINGIRTDSAGSAQLAENARAVVEAVSGTSNIKVVNDMTNVNDTAFFGVGDLAQCFVGHMGLKQLSDTQLAQVLAANVEHCLAAGRGPEKCCIYIYAHSQGTQVSRSALEALDPKYREYIRYIGIEGQSVVNRRNARAAVNFINPEDVVPKLRLLPFGEYAVDMLCGLNRDLDVVKTISLATPVKRHMSELYQGAIVDDLNRRGTYSCDCQR